MEVLQRCSCPHSAPWKESSSPRNGARSCTGGEMRAELVAQALLWMQCIGTLLHTQLQPWPWPNILISCILPVCEIWVLFCWLNWWVVWGKDTYTQGQVQLLAQGIPDLSFTCYNSMRTSSYAKQKPSEYSLGCSCTFFPLFLTDFLKWSQGF